METGEKMTLGSILRISPVLKKKGQDFLSSKSVDTPAVSRKTEVCALNGDGGGMEKQNTLLLTWVV